MVAGREYCLLVPPVLSGGAGPPPCGEACALPVGGGLAWWGVFVPRWWGSRLVGFLGLAGWGWVWKSVGCRVGWFVGALLGPEGTRVPPVSRGGFLLVLLPCGGGAGGGLPGGWGVWVVSGVAGWSVCHTGSWVCWVLLSCGCGVCRVWGWGVWWVGGLVVGCGLVSVRGLRIA